MDDGRQSEAASGQADAAELPDPHDYLADLRSFLTRRNGEGVLLGEVNLPYADTMEFFGQGDDELTMFFDFIGLQKDTALVGILGAIEANKAAEIFSDTVFNYSSYVVAAVLFLILTIPLARFTDHLIARDRRRRLAGGTT